MPDNSAWVRQELMIWIDNNENLYNNKTRDFWGNLKKKLGKGVYDPKKAEVLFKYLADRSAKHYEEKNLVFSSPRRAGLIKRKVHKMFANPDDRRAVAKLLREDFEDEMKNSGYMTKTGKPTQKAKVEAMTKVQRAKFLKARKVTQKSLDSSAKR